MLQQACGQKGMCVGLAAVPRPLRVPFWGSPGLCAAMVWCGAAHRAVAAPSSLPQTRGEGFLTHPGGSHGTLKGLVPPSLGKQKAVGAPSQHSPMLGPCSPHLLEQVGALVIQ